MPKSITAPQDQSEFNHKKSKDQLILCDHCRRTATNGIKCQGICVSDSSY